MSRTEPDEIDLRAYLAALRRRKTTVAVVTAVVLAIVVGLSLLQEPLYRAPAQVVLPAPSASSAARSDSQTGTEVALISSDRVQDAAAARLGRDPRITIDAGEGAVVAIHGAGATAEEAAREANVYAEVYIRERRQQLVDELLASAGEVRAKLEQSQRRLDEIAAELALLDAEIAAADSSSEREELQLERLALEQETAPERAALEGQRATYAQQLTELQLAANTDRTGGAQLISRAQAPDDPLRPNPIRDGSVALVVGLLLGVGLAFVRDHLDDSIKTKEDVEAATSLTALGMVPHVRGWKDRGRARVVTLEHADSAPAEAYRTLRTSLQFLALDRPLDIVQVTSANAGEGKSATVANLAVSMARSGQRVVVVDCDLRRPRVHEFFNFPNEVGLTSVLLGDLPLSAALRTVAEVEGLQVLVSGPRPVAPAEMLSSSRVADVLLALAASHDVVLLDSPPLLPVSDPLALARTVNGVLLVVSAGTNGREAHRAVELLQQVDAPVIGAVLNRASQADLYGYSYGYGYGYLSDSSHRQPNGERASARGPAGTGGQPT